MSTDDGQKLKRITSGLPTIQELATSVNTGHFSLKTRLSDSKVTTHPVAVIMPLKDGATLDDKAWLQSLSR